MAKVKGTEYENLTLITDLYDKFYPNIKKICSKGSTSDVLQRIFRGLAAKNRDALLTQIPGKQVIFNSSVEDEIFKLFDLDRKEIKETMRNSEYFKHISGGKNLSLADQLCVALPLIFASLAYKELKKQENSDLCYLLLFFKPYASRVSFLFKYGVNEDQMLYTIERDMASIKYDISRYGTVMNVLDNKSKVSYNNYIAPKKLGEKITDSEFHIIYQSGVATRVNQFIGPIYEKYMANAGKSLAYESGAAEVYNKDKGYADDTEMADIDSDDSIKAKISYKVSSYIIANPVETAVLDLAIRSAKGEYSKSLYDISLGILEEVKEKMFKELPVFISDIVSSFLFTLNPVTKEKYTARDLKSMIFIKVGFDNLIGKKSNLSKESALYRARQTFDKMLELSAQYLTFAPGGTQQRFVRQIIAYYWIYVIKLRG